MVVIFEKFILFTTGIISVVVTAIHRQKLLLLGKMKKKTYKHGHYAISFLIAGMLEILFCIALNDGAVPVNVDGSTVMILMFVGGGTLLIGIWNMIRYYICVYRE